MESTISDLDTFTILFKINYPLKFIRRFLLFSSFVFSPFLMMSQDLDSRSPKPAQGSHQQRKAEVKKAKQQKKLDKAIDKGKKRHLKHQEKQTKKMMRKSRKKAKKWNKN